MHKVLVNHLGGLSLPRKSVVRLIDRHNMTLNVYCGRKTTMQQPFCITLYGHTDMSHGTTKLTVASVLSKDSDQPEPSPCLISVFTMCLQDS